MTNKNEFDDIKFVVGIDFGTTYSGYVFSLSNDELTFYAPCIWNTAQGGMTSYKTATSLLLKSDQTLDSFGFEAEDKFASLAVDDEHKSFYFFQRFKMELHSKNIQKNSEIRDLSGKSMPAMEVFSLSIRYLKDHCLKTIGDRGYLPKPENLCFVLTVPAIWNDRSKQFMKDAALQAGIDKAQLKIALEPEAASIYCQRESLERLRKCQQQSRLTNPGTKYLVADIGGGTADFSVHQVEEEGTLTELYRASGGPFGGIYVDKEYLKIYDTIFGEGAIDQLKKRDMIEYLTITREFESKKRTVKNNYESYFYTRLSVVFSEMISNANIMERIQSSYLKDELSVIRDKLKLSPNLMKSFFQDSIKNIVNHVKDILRSIQDVNIILLVGGYVESSLVQETFSKEFANYNIIIPQECNLAVMKGAVLFGHKPLSISARLLRFSYGVRMHTLFDPKTHPEERRYFDKNGVARCKNAFRKLIEKNTKVLSTGKTVTRACIPLHEAQRSFITEVYCTETDDPKLVDDSCQLVGEFEVSVPANVTGMWKAYEEYVFGMTEIKISAEIKGTKEEFITIFDFDLLE